VRLMRCALSSVSEISLSYGEFSRELGGGAVVDFDQVVGRQAAVTDVDGRELAPARSVTIEDLLAGRLECFVPVEAASPQERPRLTPAATDDVEE